ncbi:MAG: helix-turn-helix domain-containing protein [Acidimicrobiales bacterium]|nr:helix-turn-helix domain-containing protein [Acidimicrobiales bacterium]
MTQDPDLDATVRGRLRSLRLARGWTLEELAGRAHVSPSTLSRLETGDRRLALDLLVPLARALDTTIDELVASGSDDDVIIRPRKNVVDGMTVWPLSRPGGGAARSVAKMRLTSRRRAPEPRVHPGRDWFYVLSGTVRLHLGGRELLVQQGEAAEFATMTPHALTAHGGPAEIISIFDHDGERTHLSPPR